MKLLLAVPTYGHLDPTCERALRVAVMSAVSAGVEWVGDCSPDRMAFWTARNHVAESTVDHPEAEATVWVDEDVLLPPETIAWMVDAARRYPADFVSGVYYERGDPCRPVFFHWTEDGRMRNWGKHQKGVLTPADGCGFGCVLTSRRMLRAMREHEDFDPVRKRWFWNDQSTGGLSEDLNFCRLAKKAGFQLYVHTGVQCGHRGDSYFWGPEDFERKRA